MAVYELSHVDASEPMRVDAESASKAKYKNFLSWKDAFGVHGKHAFLDYLQGLQGCKRCKEDAKSHNPLQMM